MELRAIVRARKTLDSTEFIVIRQESRNAFLPSRETGSESPRENFTMINFHDSPIRSHARSHACARALRRRRRIRAKRGALDTYATRANVKLS